MNNFNLGKQLQNVFGSSVQPQPFGTGKRTFNIAGKSIVEEDTIAEGGYGYIIRCKDLRDGKHYVLKKSICGDQARYEVASKELQFFVTRSVI